MREEACPFKRISGMTFQAHSASFANGDVEIFAERAVTAPLAAANEPEAGWAMRNPDRAMLNLFINPRDCAMVDELMAA